MVKRGGTKRRKVKRRARKTPGKIRPLRYFLLVLGICLIAGLLVVSVRQRRSREIEILGHRYSPTLRVLYETVTALHRKPIRVVEIEGSVDDSIEPGHKKEILLKLHRGCSEDIIAHELTHAVLDAEGFPSFFAIANPLSKKLQRVCRGDLDHLIINDRLLELGYDARQGFLSKANGYDNVLRLDGGESPDGQAVVRFGILHELLKFRYYIGRPSAEKDILERFPEVTKYWRKLSSSIDGLPSEPSPQEMWNIGAEYIGLGDAICTDLAASMRISALIGLEPVPLRKSDQGRPAKSLFAQSIDPVETNLAYKDFVLLRTFLANPRVMLSAAVLRAIDPKIKEIDRLNVGQFVQERNVRYLLVD